jgi:hypothetical protein
MSPAISSLRVIAFQPDASTLARLPVSGINVPLSLIRGQALLTEKAKKTGVL